MGRREKYDVLTGRTHVWVRRWFRWHYVGWYR